MTTIFTANPPAILFALRESLSVARTSENVEDLVYIRENLVRIVEGTYTIPHSLFVGVDPATLSKAVDDHNILLAKVASLIEKVDLNINLNNSFDENIVHDLKDAITLHISIHYSLALSTQNYEICIYYSQEYWRLLVDDPKPSFAEHMYIKLTNLGKVCLPPPTDSTQEYNYLIDNFANQEDVAAYGF